MVVRIVEHRADQVVQARIHAGKYRGGRLFDDIYPHIEVAGPADQELARFEHQTQVAPVITAEILEAPG